MSVGASSDGGAAAGRGRPVRALRRLKAVPTPVVFTGGLGLALLLLWRRGTLADVVQDLRAADLRIVGVAFVVYLAGLALVCARWHALVLTVRGRSDLSRAAEAFLTSMVVNYAAPVSVAIPTRAALTKRALGLTAAETGAVALWEVALDAAFLSAATLLWLVISGLARSGMHRLVGTDGRSSLTVWLALALLIATGGIAIAIVAARRLGRIRRLARLWTALVDPPRARPRIAILALALTASYWLVQGIVLWLLLQALSADAEPSLALGLVGLPVLTGMLSPVPGGAGIREALMVAVAHVQGADAAAALVVGVTYRLALFTGVPLVYAAVRLRLLTRPASPTESAGEEQTLGPRGG